MAAGGGGDAVGALLARRALGDTDERPPLVTTCAWERLRIDPVPGPRARSDFTGLGLVGGEPCEVLPTSDTSPSGRSVLPRLAETSGARIFLHDFEGGAVGLAAQLRGLATSLSVDELVVVDVGGDIMARGSEAGLRSPLADSLTLAAAVDTGIPASVAVVGPGVDAELSAEEVGGLLQAAGADVVGRITANDVRCMEAVLSWHPTEATALVVAAVRGVRGSVAMRREPAPVPLTDHTPEVWSVQARRAFLETISQNLSGTFSLIHAEEILRDVSVNEIDFERAVAKSSPQSGANQPLKHVIATIEALGATHITARRLNEMIGDPRRTPRRAGLDTVGIWSLGELREYLRGQGEDPSSGKGPLGGHGPEA